MPFESARHDADTIRANPFFPDRLTVTGLVYDVHTGLLNTVTPPEPAHHKPQRSEAATSEHADAE